MVPSMSDVVWLIVKVLVAISVFDVVVILALITVLRLRRYQEGKSRFETDVSIDLDSYERVLRSLGSGRRSASMKIDTHG